MATSKQRRDTMPYHDFMKARGIHPTRESYQTPPERKFCKLSVGSVNSFARKVRPKSTITKPFDFMKRSGKGTRKGCQSATESTFLPLL